MTAYRFSDAAEKIYEFTWHTFADQYIEESKKHLEAGDVNTLAALLEMFKIILKLLHPFMPFVTEDIWGKISGKQTLPLISSSWPS